MASKQHFLSDLASLKEREKALVSELEDLRMQNSSLEQILANKQHVRLYACYTLSLFLLGCFSDDFYFYVHSFV